MEFVMLFRLVELKLILPSLIGIQGRELYLYDFVDNGGHLALQLHSNLDVCNLHSRLQLHEETTTSMLIFLKVFYTFA